MWISAFAIAHHLLALASNFLELRSESPDCGHAARVFVPRPMETCPRNASFCEIPVRVPHSETEVRALVSPEDYPHLSAITPAWRLSSSGYVVCSKNRKLVYMHKIILQDQRGRHINGDRLDNRRCNLRPSPLPLKTAVLEFLDSPHGQGVREYGAGKRYEGSFAQNRPHGFGILREPHKETVGWWQEGALYTGIVMEFKPIPERWKDSSVPQLFRAWLLLRGVMYRPE